MKYLFIATISLLWMSNLLAQNQKNTTQISLSVVVPEEQEGLSDTDLNKLKTKMHHLVTRNSFSAEGLPNGIVIYPVLEIYDENQVSTGMQKLKTINAELSLFVKHVDDQVVFASTYMTVQGSGRTRGQAMNMILNNIKPGDYKLLKFMSDARRKIIKYYAERCETILAQAEQLSKTNEVERALASLMNVPTEVPCYDKVKDKAIEIYEVYRDKKCAEDLQLAKSKLTANAYKEGIAILGKIDPASKCHQRAVQMMTNIESDVDEQSWREWEFRREIWNDKVELQKHRMRMVRDVATSWYWRRPRVYRYWTIIR